MLVFQDDRERFVTAVMLLELKKCFTEIEAYHVQRQGIGKFHIPTRDFHLYTHVCTVYIINQSYYSHILGP